MTKYEIIEHAVSFQLPLDQAMTETYRRSWSERLLSWPWRPWIVIGERPTVYAMLLYAQVNARREMMEVCGLHGNLYGAP